ncbi:MAG: hypothetical protein KGZ43_10700 [Sulfuritalea sp.]|nr:hypothetical protein [Sulfuritalea sp.]
MTKEVLTVQENGRSIEYTYADLVKYHGHGYLGGVALAFKAMQRGLPLLADGQPPERNEIALDTAFPGPGGRDGFEMVTRMVSSGRYKVDFSIAGADVPKSPTGSYFFRFKYRGRTVDLALCPGIVREEFLRLARQEKLTPEEATRLEELKADMADRLLAQPAEALFDISPRVGA